MADLGGLTLAYLLAQQLSGGGAGTGAHISAATEAAFFTLTLPLWIVVAKLYGLYDRDEERTDHSTPDDLTGVFHMVTVGAWLLFAGAWLLGFARPELPRIVAFWGLAVVLVSVGRSAARAICRRQPSYVQRVLVVGAGDVGQRIARKLRKHPEYGLELVGFVDNEPVSRSLATTEDVLGEPERLPELVEALDVERVIVAFPLHEHDRTLELLRALTEQDVQVDIVPRFFELLSSGNELHALEGLPLAGVTPPRLPRSSQLLKRAMDVAGSALLLVLLAPLFALVALATKLDSPGPVFFRQVRMGFRGETFRIWKFRTMVVDADERKDGVRHLNMHAVPGGDARMFKAPDDPRVTRVGKILRRYSIDELPQLLNVLRGEMTLVGPRPLILEEDRHVEDWARRRLSLKPGMTGLWQVLGRSAIPFDEMVRLDYQYVTGWSIFGDMRLLLRTIPIVAGGGNRDAH